MGKHMITATSSTLERPIDPYSVEYNNIRLEQQFPVCDCAYVWSVYFSIFRFSLFLYLLSAIDKWCHDTTATATHFSSSPVISLPFCLKPSGQVYYASVSRIAASLWACVFVCECVCVSLLIDSSIPVRRFISQEDRCWNKRYVCVWSSDSGWATTKECWVKEFGIASG